MNLVVCSRSSLKPQSFSASVGPWGQYCICVLLYMGAEPQNMLWALCTCLPSLSDIDGHPVSSDQSAVCWWHCRRFIWHNENTAAYAPKPGLVHKVACLTLLSWVTCMQVAAGLFVFKQLVLFPCFLNFWQYFFAVLCAFCIFFKAFFYLKWKLSETGMVEMWENSLYLVISL